MSSSSSDLWFIQEVHPHGGMLRLWLKRQYPGLADVDDLVQECFARVVEAQKVMPIKSPKAFLFITARNLATDRIRHRQVVSIDSLAEIEALPVCDEGPSAAESVALRQEIELLTMAIQALPRRCRDVLFLRKIQCLPQKEIARELGISEKTVEAQVANGMRRCGEFLAKYGLP